MNPVYLEAGALTVVAIAILLIAWKVSMALDAIGVPFRMMAEMQGKALDVQKETQLRAMDPLHAIAAIQNQAIGIQNLAVDMQNKAVDMQGKSIDIQGKSIDMQDRSIDMHGKAIEAQLQSAEAQKEAATSLRVVMQRTLELSEHADRSARKLNAALDIYNGKVAELDRSREAFLGEVAHLQQATQEVVASRDRFLETAALLTALDRQVRSNHLESLARIDASSTQESLDRLQKSVSEGLRQLLLRDLSRTATRFPRSLRIDFIGSGIETLGRVDGGEFLASLKKVKFQLVCESRNCNQKGSSYLSDAVYEVKQPSYFVGTLRKATGSADPALVLFDSINRFDDFFLTTAAEGAKVALHVTLRIAMAHTVAVNAVVPLDQTVSALLEKIKKGVNKPEEVKDLLQVISTSDFSVRDLGGLGHNQLGNMIERRDEERNLPQFGGLSRILDPEKGYIWVCPAHAQEFTETLRDLSAYANVQASL
jgi:hypothetical protein